MKKSIIFDITKASSLSEKDKAKRAEQSRAVRPRLSSTIVLYRGSRETPKILMGQRAKAHDFMPSVYVFPGGRLDRADSFAPFAGKMLPRTKRLLETYYSEARARAIILAAIRETFEETGLCLTQKTDGPIKNINHESWDALRQKNLLADMSEIEVFGRAVTPPYRPKRFDTWFLLRHVDDTTLSGQMSDSRELLNLGWYDWDEISALKTARATDMMLTVLKDYFKHPKPPSELFYSRWQGGKFALTYEPF
jgi:8-oxo-dGTP pyrophosphatase MutT (NUDIX family)